MSVFVREWASEVGEARLSPVRRLAAVVDGRQHFLGRYFGDHAAKQRDHLERVGGAISSRRRVACGASLGAYLSLHARTARVQQRQQVAEQRGLLREVRSADRAAAQRRQLRRARVTPPSRSRGARRRRACSPGRASRSSSRPGGGGAAARRRRRRAGRRPAAPPPSRRARAPPRPRSRSRCAPSPAPPGRSGRPRTVETRSASLTSDFQGTVETVRRQRRRPALPRRREMIARVYR